LIARVRYPDGGGSWVRNGGGCAHSPRLASVSAGQAARFARTTAAACRTAVAPVGAGRIRGRTSGGTAPWCWWGCRSHPSVVDRETGPENTGDAGGL